MNTLRNAPQRQRVAFYFALASFLWVAAWAGTEAFLDWSGDSFDRRMYVLHPNLIGTFPIAALCWIIAASLVGASVYDTRRVTRYGVATLVMLLIPATPLAIVVIGAWWQFFESL